MRIFVIGRGFPTPENPMNGIFEFDQAKALAKIGHEVVFLALDLRSIRRVRRFGLKTFSNSGINVCTIDVPVGNVQDNLFVKIGSESLMLLYNKAVSLHGKPDILHSHFPKISACAASVSKKTGVPLVITEHSSSLFQAEKDNIILKYAKRAYDIAKKVIAVSPSLCALLERSYNTTAVYIPNVIDTDLFSNTKTTQHPVCTFVSVGNLIKSKGHIQTVKAFYSAFCKDKSEADMAHLTIIGDGTEKKHILELITELGIEKQVTLTGRLPREQIAEYYSKADCFVLASEYETFGVVYIEAMAAGLPVIATQCAGPECFVNESNGVLVPVGDENALTAAMIKMSGDYRNRFERESLKKFAVDNFSPEAVAAALTRVYDCVLAGH